MSECLDIFWIKGKNISKSKAFPFMPFVPPFSFLGFISKVFLERIVRGFSREPVSGLGEVRSLSKFKGMLNILCSVAQVMATGLTNTKS